MQTRQLHSLCPDDDRVPLFIYHKLKKACGFFNPWVLHLLGLGIGISNN